MSESPVPERLPSSDLRIVPMLLAAGVGVITGLVVTGIQQLTLTQMLARVQGLPLLAMAAAPQLVSYSLLYACVSSVEEPHR